MPATSGVSSTLELDSEDSSSEISELSIFFVTSLSTSLTLLAVDVASLSTALTLLSADRASLSVSLSLLAVDEASLSTALTLLISTEASSILSSELSDNVLVPSNFVSSNIVSVGSSNTRVERVPGFSGISS